MKKKIIGIALLAVIATATTWSIKQKQPHIQLSDLDQANVEAVAKINPECPDGCGEGGTKCYCYGWHEARPVLPPC